MKIVAMTCCVMDIFPQLNSQCVGGNSVNFAIQCRKSGVGQVAVLGAVGEDVFGEEIISRLKEEKIDVSYLHMLEGYTATRVVMISEKGRRLFVPENWQGGVFETFELSPADWDFVRGHDIIASVANDPNFSALLACKPDSSLLAIDFLNSRDLRFIHAHLPKIDISFIGGNRQIVKRLAPVSKKLKKLIIVNMGSKGTVAILNGETFFQEALPVKEAVDTTGCGDAYLAAFSIDWNKYRDVRKALIAGAEAAARVMSHRGAV